MAKPFHAQVLTPNGTLFDGDVVGVQVPGSEGNFEMLHNHAPIVSSLGVGKVTVKKEDNTELVFAVSGGFVEMNDNVMTLLAEVAEAAESIDRAEAEKARNEAKEKLQGKTENREELEYELAVAENRLKIADL